MGPIKQKSIRGTVRDDGGNLREVVAYVTEPRKNPGHQEFVCQVTCETLLDGAKDIAGADANQAEELAEFFVAEIFRHSGAARADD